MASYPPPLEFNSIFNEAAYLADTTGITFGQADLRYLKLSGGILSGLLTTAAGISNAGQLIFSAAGNVNNPAIQFVDAKLGLYRHGSNHLRLGVNGTAVQGWQETYIENLQQVRNIDGTQASPSVSFGNYTDAGMYIDAKNTIALSTVGTKRLSISDVDISAILPIKCDEFRTRFGLGTAGNTVYGSTNTQGMYFGLNRVNFSTDSTERLNIQNTSMNISVRSFYPDGTSALPSISFTNANTSGFALTNASGRISVSAAGSSVWQFANGGLNQSLLPTQVPVGSASAVGLCGSGFTSTGLYWTAGPILNVSVNGTQRVAFESTGVKLYGSTAGNNALYVPSGLQYYEESVDLACTWTYGTVSVSGPIRLTRIGRLVFFQLTTDLSFTITTASQLTSTANVVPTRFRPPNVVCFANAWGNRNSVYSSFMPFIETVGTINIYNSTNTALNSILYLWGFSGTWTL